MERSVVIVGATGFVGQAVCEHLTTKGWRVTGSSRTPEKAAQDHPHTKWVQTASPDFAAAVRTTGRVINLAGAHPFERRWNRRFKAEMRRSRIDTTSAVVDALGETDASDPVLVNASGIWYHAPSAGEPVTENSPLGTGFLPEMISDWETAAFRARQHGVRVTTLRIGIGIGPGGGLLREIEPIFRLGVGGPVGSGHQHVPWISTDDLARIAATSLEDPRYEGGLVVATPTPVTMNDFARQLGEALHRPARLKTPAVAMRLLKGEVSSIMTLGYKALPERLTELGFAFHDHDLATVLQRIYTSRTDTSNGSAPNAPITS